MAESPLVIEIDTLGSCSIRDTDTELVAEDLSAAELVALAAACNLVAPALDSIEKTRVAATKEKS